MSEATAEMAAPVEKESGAVKKMAEKVGRFLSETYTFKGAKVKEMRQMERVVGSFTPSQQQEMRKYFDAKAEKNAKWKVIRNWVATGAGVALGGAIIANPAAAWQLVVSAGHAVAGWWQNAGVALGSAAAGFGEGASKVGVAVRDWLFDVKNQPVIPIDKSELARVTGIKALQDVGEGLKKSYELGIKPMLLEIARGPRLPLPTVVVRP